MDCGSGNRDAAPERDGRADVSDNVINLIQMGGDAAAAEWMLANDRRRIDVASLGLCADKSKPLGAPKALIANPSVMTHMRMAMVFVLMLLLLVVISMSRIPVGHTNGLQLVLAKLREAAAGSLGDHAHVKGIGRPAAY